MGLALGLACMLGACRATAIDWRAVARSSVIVVGQLDVPTGAIAAARSSGGAHVSVNVKVRERLRGEPRPVETFHVYACPARTRGAVTTAASPSMEFERRSGQDAIVLLEWSEGALYLAADDSSAVLDPSASNLRVLESILERHARWLAEPLPAPDPALAQRVSHLVDELVADPERQRTAFASLLELGEAAVPAVISALSDRRPLAERHVMLENHARDAFEAYRQYGPELVVDALAAWLNQVTGESFGFIYNGASDAERNACVAGWRLYLRYSTHSG